MSFFTEVDKVYATWNYQTPRFLHALIRMHRPQVIVDCGTYRGLSAAWMAKAVQENNEGIVHCIDNWSLLEHADMLNGQHPKDHAMDNLRHLGVLEWVRFIDGDSQTVEWPEKVDMVYIDAWHSHNAARFELENAVSLGASIIALDDTENCVGPRLLVDHGIGDVGEAMQDYQRIDFHSDNGLTLFVRKQERRKITFSQELPFPNPGVDLRPLTLKEQKAHFKEAAKHTGLDYTSILKHTEHA